MWVLKNSPVTLFRAKIISLRLPYLLFSLPICQAIDQPHLHWSHPVTKVMQGLGAFCIGLWCLHVKQGTDFTGFYRKGTDCTGFILHHLLMRSRIVPDCWSRAYRIHAEPYKHIPNTIWKGIRYAGDSVSCKQRKICNTKTFGFLFALYNAAVKV